MNRVGRVDRIWPVVRLVSHQDQPPQTGRIMADSNKIYGRLYSHRGETDGIFQNLFFHKKWLTLIYYFSREEVRRQYKRTYIGPFWIVLTQFVVVFAIAFVYTSVFRQEYDKFLPFLSASIISWNFISNTLTAAPSTFITNSSTMKAFELPSSVYTAQLIAKMLTLYLHALVVHACVVFLFAIPMNRYMLFFPITLLLICLFLYAFSVFLAIAGARFRDVIPAGNSFMYLMFLFTPVLWPPNLVPTDRLFIVEFNPFFYLIDALRAPLLGQALHHGTLSMLAGLIILAWGLAVFAAWKARRNAVFWI
jgi:ABC-2 type transport system permease protein